MLPSLLRQPESPRDVNESDTWFVSSGIQETYEAIVKEVDNWRDEAGSRKKGMFSFLSRKKNPPFLVDESVSPRLYRVKDDERGEISFELTEVEGGGTSIKSMYYSNARALVQNFKARMPVKIPAAAPKVCPSCGKEVMPDFKTCPFCGTTIR